MQNSATNNSSSQVTILKNIKQLITLKDVLDKKGRFLKPEDLGLINNACVVAKNGIIEWVGLTSDLSSEWLQHHPTIISGEDLIISPVLVDCHTHLVFAGNRAQEYLMRLNGITYQEIAAKGGGINFTATKTKNAQKDILLNSARDKIIQFIHLGVGVLEIKTGYALDPQGEIKILEIIHQLKNEFKNKIILKCTYMAAHAVPAQFSSSQDYLHQVVIPTLNNAVQNSACSIDAVDIFHENNYFSTQDVLDLYQACQQLGLPLKLHADEFQNNEGAKLACSLGCLSADHLLNVSNEGVTALAQADSHTVAVLLPGTAFFLGKAIAPAKKLLAAGACVAMASDFNPGSCHWNDLFSIARSAAPTLGFNETQFWAAITYNAALALGITDLGIIKPGFRATFTAFHVPSCEDLLYNWCEVPKRQIISL